MIVRRLLPRILLLALALALATVAAAAADTERPGDRHGSRPVHTYSIVARDPDTGEIGVAVQSHWFSVGPVVAWGEAGVGVVATQALADPSYGPLGLALMRAGRTADQALAGLLEADPNSEVRQVAMLDAAGHVAAHTGERCIPAAGQIVGEEFSVQANLMIDDEVWPAMAAAFRGAEGDLAERMLIALEAAEAVGGDIRGKQSAAILIVSGTSTGRPWADTVMDLRVEDHPEPLPELRRLVRVHRAYEHMNRGDLAIERDDLAAALREFAAAEAILPDNPEMKFWHAVSLVNIDRTDEAVTLLREILAGDDRWATVLQRLVGAGLLEADDAEVRAILERARP